MYPNIRVNVDDKKKEFSTFNVLRVKLKSCEHMEKGTKYERYI